MTNQPFMTWSEFSLFPSIKNPKLYYEAKVNYPSSYLTDYLKKCYDFGRQRQLSPVTPSTAFNEMCIYPPTSYLNHEVIFFFYFTNTPNNLKITFFNFFIRVGGYINILTAVIVTPRQAIHRWLTQGVILCTRSIYIKSWVITKKVLKILSEVCRHTFLKAWVDSVI